MKFDACIVGDQRVISSEVLGGKWDFPSRSRSYCVDPSKVPFLVHLPLWGTAVMTVVSFS